GRRWQTKNPFFGMLRWIRFISSVADFDIGRYRNVRTIVRKPSYHRTPTELKNAIAHSERYELRRQQW
ncbi:MAG: hypothetical protein FWD57_06335, partial [Polyangiaceae bacterium]|nr:hypothetical protein [Polyangiaceae bacterium]